MEALPPVWLGALLAMSFAVVLAGRTVFMRRFVLAAPVFKQPGRQGLVEFWCCVAAGTLAGTGVEAYYGFPLVSGWKLVLGGAAAGFYLGLESGLLRLRALLLAARRPGGAAVITGNPPELRSQARRFLLLAGLAMLLLMGLFGLIWAGDVAWLSMLTRDPVVLAGARRAVALEIGLVIAVLLACAARIIVLYAGNLRLLFDGITQGLARVRQGDLTVRLPVATADEFGLIAAGANAMIEGLSHRVRLLDALKVAEDVQRNLLPAAPPQLPGLDIAAKSVYCDETGGDSFDFIALGPDKTAVIVADVAGHGVGPALLMASARATMRMAVIAQADPAAVVRAVNARLVEDVYGTGRFLTLFYLEIDVAAHQLRWVRAGHDPALIYLPQDDAFIELAGSGLPLGVVAQYAYQAGQASWPAAGVLFIGTDGIWEARNRAGEMFGKKRLQAAIREGAGLSADQLLAFVTEVLTAFREGTPQEDDITMLVIEFPGSGRP